jgi:Ser/Thr protein kinase RdoA (MazF antagonist)
VKSDPALALPLFGLKPEEFTIERIGSGHINQTYRMSGKKTFVLQRVNKNVFREPDLLAANLNQAASYLAAKAPGYLFLKSIRSPRGNDLEFDGEGYPWRLFPYIDNTITMDAVESAAQARRAAAAFGKLTRLLDGLNPDSLTPTIPRFHDLGLRWEQFEEALAGAGDRLTQASTQVVQCHAARHLVTEYERLISGGTLRLRVVHNDTKINNVLFDRVSGETKAVIDLDTLMPGYFIYDLGDMVRTFVSPVSEEERDLSRVTFRREVYTALLDGYLSEMGEVLTPAEREAIPFAGKMMTFIMALRFLADYLRGNTYYTISYPEQNLVRASNQLRMLTLIEELT